MDAIIRRAKRLQQKTGEHDVFTPLFEINLLTTLMPFRQIHEPIWCPWDSKHQVSSLNVYLVIVAFQRVLVFFQLLFYYYFHSFKDSSFFLNYTCLVYLLNSQFFH